MFVALGLHRNIELLLRLSKHLDAVVDHNKHAVVLDDDAADDLLATATVYLSTFYQVSQVFREEAVALFSVSAKAHYLFHLCILSRCSNLMRGLVLGFILC